MPIPDPDLMTGVPDADLDAWLAEEERRGVDSLAAEVWELEATAKAKRAQARELQEEASAMLERVDRNMEAIQRYMDAHHVTFHRNDYMDLRLAVAGGTPKIEVLVDAELLPYVYQRWSVAPKKDALADALEPGGELVDPGSGAVLARMAERGRVLRRERVKPEDCEEGVVREGGGDG